MSLAGVDGCRTGWVVATERGVSVVTALTTIDATTVGVDMPIGLPESAPRACDREARAFLGPRRASVFPAPARACLPAEDYGSALAASRQAIGVGLSKQAYHLLSKIRELDALVEPCSDRFVEIHPECAFLRLNALEPLAAKRTAAGAARREELLAAEFGTMPGTLRGARRDDVLDAFAVLWSTMRFACNRHVTFGDGSVDGRGLPMRIVS